jgi:hypothetical protein
LPLLVAVKKVIVSFFLVMLLIIINFNRSSWFLIYFMKEKLRRTKVCLCLRLFVRSRWLFLFYSRNAKIGTEKVGGKDENAVSSHFLVANSIGFSDFTKALGGMSN